MNAVDAAALNPPPAEVRLWEGPAPMSVTNAPPENVEPGNDQPSFRRISRIEVPTLTIYSPPKEKNTGIAAIICPGGAYRLLSWDKEGLNVAKWLQERGITGVVLKYRLPAPNLVPNGTLRPFVDAQQAFRLLRARAAEFGIKTNRIGIIGFSAGGHLAAYAATTFHRLDSCRPDFCVLAYPVITMLTNTHTGSCTNLLGADPPEQLRAKFSTEKLVTRQTPPTFLMATRDDKSVPVTNSLMFAEACERAGVPVELHLYDQGGHGFGLGVNGGDVTNWPAQLEKFLDRYR